MQGRKILIGITGGIAAYKAADLVSQLVKQGADLQVVMTNKAADFVAPLTFKALSGKPVWLDEFDSSIGLSIPHVQLAEEADLFIIVPASANTIAKLAMGIADNLLTALALVHDKRLFIAPAMNTNMYRHPAVVHNLQILRKRGVKIIEPGEGRLACGALGPGRLAAVETIIDEIQSGLFAPKTLHNKRVLITAGGTREIIDPVRYIGNRSSGKMGFALAKGAMLRGAQVILVSGPVDLKPPGNVEYVPVETAQEMREAVLSYYNDVHMVIKAAAVADYKPVTAQAQKIKKTADNFHLSLTKTSDILQELGEQKQQQLLIGFAAETEDLLQNAGRKLANKNLDLIVANDVSRPDAGFNVDTNLVTLLFPDGRQEELPLMSKEKLAHRIFHAIENMERFQELD